MVTSVVTNSGVITLLIRYATLDPTTGYFRHAIWQYASISVWQHPLYGIGFDNYRRPDWMVTASIDAHWLLLAVRYGLPVALAMFAASILAIGGLVRAERLANKRDSGFYRGILISFGTLVLMAFTVTLQGGVLTWFTILLGGCVACAQHVYVVDWALWNRSRRPTQRA
jgi:O-antigen ligase